MCQSWIIPVYWYHFLNNICLLHASMPHFDESWNISSFFIIIVLGSVFSEAWCYYSNLSGNPQCCFVPIELCPTLCNPTNTSTISWSLLEFMSTELMMLSNHRILCQPFLLLLSIFPSIRVRFNESALHISPSNEYSRFISFRIDWFDFLVVQGTLKSLLQCCNLKASILRLAAFFMVQLSHPYVTTANTIALTIQTFVGKVLPCFLICFLALS